MDITFEEVAFVIQDARFQQAIFDSDIPKPDKKFPQPPRGFVPSQFLKDNNIGLGTLLFEPIGRFFLEQCAQEEADDTSKAAAAVEKDGGAPSEKEMLLFTQTVADLRRMDPAGYMQVADIEAVCERFRVQLDQLTPEEMAALESEEEEHRRALSSSGGGGEFATVSPRATSQPPLFNAAAAASEGSSSLGVSPVSPSAARIPSSPAVPRGVLSPHQSVLSSSQQQQPTIITSPATLTRGLNAASANNNDEAYTAASQQRHSNMMSFQSDAPQRYDDRGGELTSAQGGGQMSTYYNNQVRSVGAGAGGSQASPAAQAQVYSSAVAAATQRKLALEGKQHSLDCIRLNLRVTLTIERRLARCYDRLVTENRKLFHMYACIKWYAMQPVTDRDVRFHRVLGMGAFGTVNGCIIMPVGTMLAIKTMNKKRIKAKKAKSQVTAERDALEALAAHSSPYCLRLRYSYETKEAYHFILPIAIAGDLKYHLKDGPFSFERARYYACEVALGLGHIHSLGLVIRDLKPRNILLTRSGHCQISDFGLAVAITEQKPVIQGRAGTEGYWSPEVINGLAYSMDADWWSFGVCLFEFIAGTSPFSTKHTGLKTRNDGTRRAEIKFPAGGPDKFDETAKPLVLALLSRRVVDRVRGMNEVLNSDRWVYWKDFDLGAVRRNEMPPPWLPEKGHIYAASQGEIQENEDPKETRKVKILPEDSIPFTPFVDLDGHQRDIVRLLELYKQDGKLSVEDATVPPAKSCCVS